jgi:CRP-like cAMP-binding protein
MTNANMPLKNHLLAALPSEVQMRLTPTLELASMPLGKVLYESGDIPDHVYFPVDSIVSLLYVMESGASAEISVVGNEGLVGISLFMGGESTPSRALVQSAGSAYRMPGQKFKDEFNRHGDLLQLMLRYTQALITQMAQTAVCNRHHSIDQQLCRWLLLSLDRLPSNKLSMTQELIANMLGVRREGGHRSRGQAPEARRHRVQPRAYHRARQAPVGAALLRVLSCGEERDRSSAAVSLPMAGLPDARGFSPASPLLPLRPPPSRCFCQVSLEGSGRPEIGLWVCRMSGVLKVRAEEALFAVAAGEYDGNSGSFGLG